MSLTILHLGAELALFGILKDRVVAGICAFHGTVAAGLVKEGTISTWSGAAKQGCPLTHFPGAWSLVRWKLGTFSEAHHGILEVGNNIPWM